MTACAECHTIHSVLIAFIKIALSGTFRQKSSEDFANGFFFILHGQLCRINALDMCALCRQAGCSSGSSDDGIGDDNIVFFTFMTKQLPFRRPKLEPEK